MATALTNREPPADAGQQPAAPAAAAPGALATVAADRDAGSGGLPAEITAWQPGGNLALRRGRRSLGWRVATGRRARLPLVWLSFAVIVGLPVALAAGYYFFVAADQYVTEFRFAVRSGEPMRSEYGGLLPTDFAAAPVVSDSYIVVDYIRSRAMIDDLGRTIDLRRTFATRRADWPARLHLPVAVEDLVEYWKGQVDAFFDASNGTIVVRVRAFTRQDSFRLAEGVLDLSERLVNRLSARARQTALHDSQAEVTQAEARLAAALARLRAFRDQQGLVDPNKAADASEALADRLRDELVRARTELSTLQQYMRDDAPPVALLEARIKSLEEQRLLVAGGVTETTKTQSPPLSQEMGRYEELDSERHFAENAYQHALEALDRSRLNADRQQVYIADFVPPRLPEEALYPRRARALAIVFLVAFAVWGIGGLTARSVRDHL
jgi:capsular polysaccharide transport system permease protein